MKVADRVWKAIQNDWSFTYFKKAGAPTSRHSVWIKKPDTDNWYVEKVDGDIEDWENALLDMAGVPD